MSAGRLLLRHPFGQQADRTPQPLRSRTPTLATVRHTILTNHLSAGSAQVTGPQFSRPGDVQCVHDGIRHGEGVVLRPRVVPDVEAGVGSANGESDQPVNGDALLGERPNREGVPATEYAIVVPGPPACLRTVIPSQRTDGGNSRRGGGNHIARE